MEGFERTISILDYVLDTPKKRHITGGILFECVYVVYRAGTHGDDNKKGGHE